VRQRWRLARAGYVLKNAVDLELGAAIRRVAKGETVLDSNSNARNAQGKRHAALPARTRVLQMIVDGKSNKEIAVVLDLSANTIAVHRANMWTLWEPTRPRAGRLRDSQRAG